MKKMFLVALAVLMFVGVKPAVAVDGKNNMYQQNMEIASRSWSSGFISGVVCSVILMVVYDLGYRSGFNSARS
jgi:hypothetical protein